MLTALNGCGWRLRGSSSVDIDKAIYLQYEKASTELRNELEQVLKSNKVRLVDNVESADLILILHYDKQGRRVLSVNKIGVVNEFELQYQLNYSVQNAVGVNLLAPETIRQQRDYSYNQNEVLAKDKEERLLFDFMRRTVVQKVMRQLQRVAGTSQTAAQNAD